MTSPGDEQHTASTRGRGTLLGAVAGSGLGAALVLALLAGAGAFAATVVPRENAQAQSAALRAELAAAAPGTSSVFGRSDLSSLSQSIRPTTPDSPIPLNQIAEPETALRKELASLGIPLSTKRTDYWQGLGANEDRVGFTNATPTQAALPQVRTALNYRSNLTDHATLVQGAMPDRATGPVGTDQAGFFQVAVTEQTAATFHLHVGETLTLASAAVTPIQLQVTGILRVRAPADDFWAYDVTAAAPQLVKPTRGAPPFYESDVFIGENELDALQAAFIGQVSVVYAVPLDLSHVTSAQAQPLADAIVTATSDAVDLPLPGDAGTHGQPTALSLDLAGGPTQPLGQFLGQRRAVDAVLSMVVGSLAALGAAVLLLCILLLAERRSAEFTLLRARGASGRQLALLAVRASAISVLPAAAGVALGCVLIPSPLPVLADWWVPALIALIALVGPGAVAAIRYRARAAKTTDRWSAAAAGVRTLRARAGRDRIRRAVGSTATVALCVGAVAVLRHYGSGSNVLAALAPFLIAVPIAIGIYYLAPPVIRALTSVTARRRDAVPFIAMARASRGSTIAWLPSLALVLTLAVVAVGSIVHDTVVTGEVNGSWAAVGADDVITAEGASSAGFGPAAVHALSTLPGVTRSATAGQLDVGDFVLTPVSDNLPDDTVMLVVDPARYSALTAGTPAAQLPAGLAEPADPHAPVPVIASAPVAEDFGSGSTMGIDGVQFPVRQVATATATAALPGAHDFLILPSWALHRHGIAAPAPTVLMLDGTTGATTLTTTLHRIAPGSTLAQRATELSALTHAPFQTGTFDTLDLAMLGAALLAVVALLSSLTMGARSREQALARLATMGLSRRQANRLVLLENLPALAAALIGGVVCTVAIGALIGPGIDLGVFTGTARSVPLRIDLWTLTLAGAATALTAAVTLAGHTAAAHRRGVTAALRLGNGE
ncbi:MAG TPA: FtsX-like permease family protein [Pseudonocardiaceae bacterium]|nr:FtsX-like permease family protein [Pseudonocardiaceae bacterium]